MNFCLFRYKREFGFTIEGRPIIIDDIRVRGVGKTQAWEEHNIPESKGEPRVEKVN